MGTTTFAVLEPISDQKMIVTGSPEYLFGLRRDPHNSGLFPEGTRRRLLLGEVFAREKRRWYSFFYE